MGAMLGGNMLPGNVECYAGWACLCVCVLPCPTLPPYPALCLLQEIYQVSPSPPPPASDVPGLPPLQVMCQTSSPPPQVIYQISNCYDLLGDFKNAVKWLEMLSSLAPNDPGVLAKLGAIHARFDDEAKALHYYQVGGDGEGHTHSLQSLPLTLLCPLHTPCPRPPPPPIPPLHDPSCPPFPPPPAPGPPSGGSPCVPCEHGRHLLAGCVPRQERGVREGHAFLRPCVQDTGRQQQQQGQAPRLRQAGRSSS